jgi:hypothetical protein
VSAAGALAEGEGEGGRAPASVDALIRAVFALLVLACFGAFFLTQRLKHTPTAVQRFELTPTFDPGGPASSAEEAISFKLARAERVTVQIIDAGGNVVATLVHEHPVARYKQFSLRWNGRRGTARRFHFSYTARGHPILIAECHGRLAPPGEYRVWVTLSRQSRPVPSPRAFKLLGR